MADKILLKRSSTADAVPSAEALELGELAINVADGRLYFKKADGTVVRVAMESEVGGSVAVIKKSQLITASGNWVRPQNMVGNDVRLTMVGGGASGQRILSVGYGGWGGQWVIDIPVDIGAAASVACTIGQGGAAVAAGVASNPGGTTSFGAFLSVIGGSVETGGQGAGGAPGRKGTTSSSVLLDGADTPLGYGGRFLTGVSASWAAGGGGLVLDNSGVAGGAQANTVTVATGYGAGGAAGASPSVGFHGAPGAILVEWMEAVSL